MPSAGPSRSNGYTLCAPAQADPVQGVGRSLKASLRGGYAETQPSLLRSTLPSALQATVITTPRTLPRNAICDLVWISDGSHLGGVPPAEGLKRTPPSPNLPRDYPEGLPRAPCLPATGVELVRSQPWRSAQSLEAPSDSSVCWVGPVSSQVAPSFLGRPRRRTLPYQPGGCCRVSSLVREVDHSKGLSRDPHRRTGDRWGIPPWSVIDIETRDQLGDLVSHVHR